jgi:DNA-binding transcriptional MerR regulator
MGPDGNKGLLPMQRSPAGYRLYDDDAVERLAFITAGKHLGLPLQGDHRLADRGSQAHACRCRTSFDRHPRRDRCNTAVSARAHRLRRATTHALKQPDAPASWKL